MAGGRIKKIVIEEGAEACDLTVRILRKLDRVPKETVSPGHERSPFDPRRLDKETLRLIRFDGQFLKPCPGTRDYICCGYQILHTGTNCPFDCTYCILQSYFNQPSLRIFVNIIEKLDRIGSYLDQHANRFFRIGTGEFMDSLSLDGIAGWHDILPSFIGSRKNAVLELKTKTDRVEGFLSSPMRDRMIMSWSLNGPAAAAHGEHGAASIEKRLRAARQCQKQGFKLGFHFDPLIRRPGWREDYARTIELMDQYIDPKGIVWLSLGCFRYMPDLKRIILARHPGTRILDGEFVPGLDGKMRYFKPMRIEMYGCLNDMLTKWYPDLGLYLCMESDDVWQTALGWSPGDSKRLSDCLDQRAIRHFPTCAGG